MSNTPKTDTKSFNAIFADPIELSEEQLGRIQQVVEAEFARELERENDTLRRKLGLGPTAAVKEAQKRMDAGNEERTEP